MEEGITNKLEIQYSLGVFGLSRNETPEEKRERLEREELEKNPYVLYRPEKGYLEELIDDIGWKGIRKIIIVLIIGLVFYRLFF